MALGSPDLNPIENIWGLLAFLVYGDGKQYNTRDDLKKAILEAWDKLPQDLIDNVIDSMKKRCVEVLKTQGKTIKY